MKEAYDLKRLAELAKDEGLEILEDGAESLYKAFKSWIKESAAKSSTPVDDLAANFIDQLDAIVLPNIDKINPADNAEPETPSSEG